MPRNPKPKKRNAWLITWESPRKDYLRDLNRPRVVLILKPQIGLNTIRTLLPILFMSESELTFSEKIGRAFSKKAQGFREQWGQICYSDNPWLFARRVTDLYVERHENTIYRQTLHWMEEPRYGVDPKTFQVSKCLPAIACSEDVRFDVLWFRASSIGE